MNRRNFFSTLAKATAGFMILPAATTYERVWRVQKAPLITWFANGDFGYRDIYNKIDDSLEQVPPTENELALQKALFNTIFFNARIPKELIPA